MMYFVPTFSWSWRRLTGAWNMGAPGLWEGTDVEALGQMTLSPQLDGQGHSR